MVYILLLVHIYFCFKTKFIQRHVVKGIRYSLSGKGSGTYAAFAQALGTTVGPGNIVGVAVAISTGGAGAVFWMWLCGILAMPTKYAEGYLSIKYAKNGVGGPMVLLERFGYPRLSRLWCLLCIAAGLFMGAAVPSRSLSGFLPTDNWVSGAVLALAVLLTMSLGVSGISRVCSLVVPIMSVGFIALCVVSLAARPNNFFYALRSIVADALSFGAVAGGGIGAAIKSGVARGLYSNEAGLGSGGVLAAEARDENTEMSALAAMTTCFWDTVVMCALTGVVFVAGGVKAGCDVHTAVIFAFSGIPHSHLFLALSMTLFVFATVIGWYCIAYRAAQYCFGNTAVFNLLFVAAVFFGAVISETTLWGLSDAVNFMMLAPSLFIFVKLSDKISLHIK